TLEGGDGFTFTVGVITHAGAAKAGAAKAMAAPAAARTTPARPALRRPRRPARFRLSSRVMVFTCGNPFLGAPSSEPWSARALMRRPAQTRADARADGELPALSRRPTVAEHVVVDVGTSGRIAGARTPA